MQVVEVEEEGAASKAAGRAKGAEVATEAGDGVARSGAVVEGA